MTINFNVSGKDRKALVQALSDLTCSEPEYAGAPTFAYKVGDYTVGKNGVVDCPDTAQPEAVALLIDKLKGRGFTPEKVEDEVPASVAAKSPDVAPEAAEDAQLDSEAKAPASGQEAPDVGEDPVEEDAPVDNNRLTIRIPRDKLADDALARLKVMVKNKEALFKRALLTDALPINATEDEVSFPWFKLTGVDGEAEAYAQFITALCQMAREQKRVLDKPYDGDNDRFAMRIFMVRLGMKGAEFALARKLMMQHLSGNSGWRYEDASSKREEHSNPNRSVVQHIKKAYQNGVRVELVPTDDGNAAEVQIGAHGAVIGVDDNGSVFIQLDNGSAFGIAFSTEQSEVGKEESVAAPESESEAEVVESTEDCEEE
jgi:hypothetical protein